VKAPAPRALCVLPEGAPAPRRLPLGAREIRSDVDDALLVVGEGALLGAVPDAATRPPGSLVVLAEPVRSGVLGVLLGAEPARSRAERATALLRRGWVRLGAAREAGFDVVWGFAS
jgi:hypothetical protein